MRVVFMGTPAIAATVLTAIAGKHEIVGVFTRPDAVRGRGKALVASDVKVAAEGLGVPVYTPERLDDGALDLLASLDPDVICVVAYGVLLPARVIDLPRHGCLNVHASLLPRWRGAAPIERAIMAGDELAGVSIMKMDEGLDTGDYCEQRSVALDSKNVATLEGDLAKLGAEALISVLDMLERSERPRWIAQDESLVTYAAKIEKGELDLDPELSSIENIRRVRASSDAHPSRAVIEGRTCNIIDGETCSTSIACGSVLWANKKMLLGCAEGSIVLKTVKPAGKREMDAKAFAAGIKDLKSKTLTWERL